MAKPRQQVERVLAAIDADALVRDAAALVQVPSETGDERAAAERLADLAAAAGLDARLVREDLEAARAADDHPGEETPREELWSVEARLPGAGGPRLAVNGHLDVVGPGAEPWSRDPWSGAVADGVLHGRGSVDMKGAVVAALHGLAAVRRAAGEAPGEAVLLATSSEEDGGVGAFAALRRDAAYAACLIVEPTEWSVVCAQAGALTFSGTVPGRSAHACVRLEGASAIDRYVRIHLALAAHEEALNSAVEHPLMQRHALPYPLLVGRVAAGTWSSQVPDRLTFEGRLGVRVGEPPDVARAALAAAVRAASDDGEGPVELRFDGGQFASAETPLDHPWVAVVRAALGAELGAPPPLAGVTYGADMRLFTAHGIPTVMAGTRGIARAHAVDEHVAVADLVRVARLVARTVLTGLRG